MTRLGELLAVIGLIAAGITTKSAGLIAIGLSLLGIAVGTTALVLVIRMMREDADKANGQNGTLDDLSDQAARIEAQLHD